MDFTAVYVGSALLSHWSVVGVLIIMPWVLGFFMLTFVSHSVIWLCWTCTVVLHYDFHYFTEVWCFSVI